MFLQKHSLAVCAKTSILQKLPAAVVLACTVAGNMLPPMTIFKGKRELKLS